MFVELLTKSNPRMVRAGKLGQTQPDPAGIFRAKLHFDSGKQKNRLANPVDQKPVEILETSKLCSKPLTDRTRSKSIPIELRCREHLTIMKFLAED